MPTYFYTAKSLDGETKTGSLNVEDTRQLAQDLKSQGFLLVSAELESERKKNTGITLPSFLGRVSDAEKMMMVRNLWVMVATGLSLVRAFNILAGQAKSKKFKTALLDIGQQLGKGKSLHDSFKKYPNIFPELFLSMIEVGEESGTLEDVLQVLANQMKKDHELKSKVKSAMIYPSIILSVMIMVGILVALFVLPKISVFFEGLHAELPIYTQILIWLGTFSTTYWYVVLFTPFIAAGLVWSGLKTKPGKRFLDTALLRIPFISSLVKKNNAASLIRSLSSLISSGVPLLRSIEISSGTVGNIYFKQALAEAYKKIEKGEKLFSALKPHSDIFPYGAIEIIEIGEETGKTSVILEKLAEFYEEEVIEAAGKIAVIIEPALIIVLAGVVAFFAFSIIEPMYSVLGEIG